MLRYRSHLAFTIALISFTVTQVSAQTMTNNGASIFSDNALIFVSGELVTQDTGTYDNSGTIEVTGDWSNNTVAPAVFINATPGTVLLSGGAQNIQGTSVTNFYDLKLTGTGNKTQMIDASTADSLVLNDRELATDTFTMYVTNTAPACITRSTGFVSSLDTGGLSRDMLSLSTYIFPVGSSVGTLRYRPAEVTPNSALAHTFKVRLANTDATLEGWDRNINDSTFCMVNPDYYHMISRTNGASAADVTIWFDDLLDNVYQEMAHWQTVPRWENMGVVTTVMNPSPILSSATSSGWGNYSFPAFILGSPAAPLALSVTSTSICSTDTLTFNATPGFTNYEFFNNSVSIQNGTSDTLILTGLSSGDTIEVTGTDINCNAYSNKLVITVTTQPVAAIAGTDTICEGTSTALTASGGTTFLWNTTEITASIVVSPIADSSYTVIVSNGACADTATFNVTVNPLPIANITGGGVTICDGIAVNLNGDPGDSYLWTPTAEITQNIVVSPSVTTTYTLTVTNSCGTDIATTDITVLAAAQAGPDFELCKNLDPLGYLDTAAAFPAGGTWSSPDPLVDPNLNPDGFIDHISIPWGNGYQIVYTAGGCTDTMLLNVTGAQTGNDTVICPSGAFFLSVAQPPGGTWSYLDPTTGIQTTTNIIDPITGEIDKGDLSGDITFVYTSQGCPDTMVVTLCGENDIWVPNVFSPNGDFWNDIVRVRGEAVDYVTIVIYDRWGELIFDGNSTEAAMNTGWDGTKKGKELAPQVFVYYLKGAFLDGEEFVKQGNITLVK